MGFEQDKINWAWNKSDIKTVEGLINYMDANEYTPEDNKMQLEDQPKENQGVDGVVKKEIVEKLMEQGYSKLIAEKSTVLSGNKTEEEALAWIREHEKDADFNEPIVIEKPQSNLTPEEAKKKAKKELNELNDTDRLLAVQAFRQWILQQKWLKTPTGMIFKSMIFQENMT